MTLFADVSPRAAGPDLATVPVRITMNAFGQVDTGLAWPLKAPYDTALEAGPPEPKATAALLDRLPPGMVAVAIIELREPMDESAFTTWRHRYEQPIVDLASILMSPPYANGRPSPVQPGNGPIGWPDPDLGAFRRWAAEVRPSDATHFVELGLPDPDAVRRAGEEGRVYGVVVEDVTIDQLRSFTRDPAVQSVNFADVAFDLHPPE